MRTFFAAASISLLAFTALAQQASVSVPVSRDINGYRTTTGPEVVSTRTRNASETTEKLQSINGRLVPIEKVDEKVVRDDGSVRIVERVIRRYDQTGNPAGMEKVVVEEQKSAHGSSTVNTTTYRSDVNGSMQVAERAVTRSEKSGNTTTSDTVVERPTISGGFDTVEKRSDSTVKQDNSYQENAVIYRKDANGSFYPAVRRVTDHSESNGRSSDNTAEYEIGPSGGLELHGQTVAESVKRPDGSTEIQVDIFRRNVPGVVNDGRGLKLQERQLVERRAGRGNEVVETVSARRPTVSDPNTLGPATQIS